jgi:hypothetical protein
MDGFPIYGPYAASGKLMQGSSAGRNATLGACNFDVRFVDQSINQSINRGSQCCPLLLLLLLLITHVCTPMDTAELLAEPQYTTKHYHVTPNPPYVPDCWVGSERGDFSDELLPKQCPKAGVGTAFCYGEQCKPREPGKPCDKPPPSKLAFWVMLTIVSHEDISMINLAELPSSSSEATNLALAKNLEA